ELIRIRRSRLIRLLANDSRRYAPIDIDGCRGLVYRLETLRDNQGRNHREGDERQDAPPMPPQQQEVVIKRYAPLCRFALDTKRLRPVCVGGNGQVLSALLILDTDPCDVI